jgi:hypothetical protein
MTVVASLICLSAILGSGLLISRSHVEVWPAVSLVALTLAATQAESVFGDESAVNGTIIVVVGATGAFAAGVGLWLPVSCGLVAGLGWDHVRHADLRKIVVNASCTTVAVLCAALAGRSIVSNASAGVVTIGLGAAAAAVTYWIVNNLLVAAVLTAVGRRRFASHLAELIRSETLLVPLAAIAFVVGYRLMSRFRVEAAVLAIIELLLLAELVVFRRPHGRHVASGLQNAVTLTLTSAIGASLLLLVNDAPDPVSISVVILATVTAALVVQRRTGLGWASALAGTAVAAVLFHRSAPEFAPFVVALLGVGVAALARRLADPVRTGLTALGIIGCAALLPIDSGASVATCLLIGIAIAGTALAVQHLSRGVALYRRLGSAALRPAIDVFLVDAPIYLAAGIVVGLSAWLGFRTTLWAGSAGVAVVALITARSPRRRRSNQQEQLSDGDLCDVLQSALLDLPGSALPES